MKKLMITAAALMIACAAYGQGQFFLNTHDTTAGNVINFTFNGAPASGSDLFVEVSAGPDASHLTALTPLLALSRTGAGAGLANPFSGTYTIPTMASGTATVALTAFQGTSSATATATSGPIVVGTVALTTPPTPPNEVTTGLKTIAIVPEPTTLALGLLGLGSLLAIRRRK
jgi:hypothetical protein